MKDFVKKIEDLSSLGEDKRAEKVLRKLLAKLPTTSIAFRNWQGHYCIKKNLMKHFVPFKKQKPCSPHSL